MKDFLRAYRLPIFLILGAIIIVILIFTILAPQRNRLRVSLGDEAFASYISRIAESPGEESSNEEGIELHFTDRRPDIRISPGAPGERLPSFSSALALDPLVWIADRRYLPERETGDISLQELVPAVAANWTEEGYPLLIPGDAPLLFLPILIKLQEDISGRIPRYPLEHWDEMLAAPGEWRRSGQFDQAFALLDAWEEAGYLSPQWTDFDEAAFTTLIRGGQTALFPARLSWRRAQSREVSFNWTVLPDIPGAERRNYRLTTRLLEIELSPRRRLAETADELMKRLSGPEAAEQLVVETGWTPAVGQGPFLNREDRDARAAARSAVGWIVVP